VTLDFLILADGANVAEGKLYVHGGAVTRATFPAFPSNPMVLTAVARFLIDVDELEEPQQRVVVFQMRRDDGVHVEIGRGELRWDPRAALAPIRQDEDQGVVLVAPMLIAFERPGRYELQLLLDGELVGSRGMLIVGREDA
jgi:hypothetical protein